jgi:Protein of unknown function (DUF2630)
MSSAMDDSEILTRIKELVDAEHRAREQGGDDEPERIAALERALDQCWDLLRQRRAAREFGKDPDQAEARPESQVEGYRQ